MRMRFFGMLALLWLLCSVCCAECYWDETPLNTKGEYTAPLQPDQPNRIVVFPLYAEEILLDMISPERIVYVGHAYWEEGALYSPTMPLTKSIPGANWQNSDENAIAELQPDLLILSADLESAYKCGDLFPRLLQANTPVLFVSPPTSIQDIKSLIHTLGEAVGVPEKADEMLLHLDAELKKIDEIIRRIPANDHPKAVYYHAWQSEFSIVAEYCALDAMFDLKNDYVQLDDKRIAAWNPDVIFFNPVWLDSDGSILQMNGQYTDDVRVNILRKPTLANTTAIKEGRVYPIHLHRSHYVAQSMMEIIQCVYPHLVNDHGMYTNDTVSINFYK